MRRREAPHFLLIFSITLLLSDMDYQQANYVKHLIVNKYNLNQVAREYFKKYGRSIYCEGPNGSGQRDEEWPAACGHDLKGTAERILHTRF